MKATGKENRLSLKHLIEVLRMEHEIELRTEDNYELFVCRSNSQALEPYLNKKVIEWFAYGDCRLVVLIGETDDR